MRYMRGAIIVAGTIKEDPACSSRNRETVGKGWN